MRNAGTLARAGHLRHWLAPLLAAAAITTGAVLLAACGSGVQGPPQTARPAEEMHRDFGGFQVHFNAIRTDELRPEVARAYGIERSANRVMLNVAMLSKAPDGRTSPADGTVTVSARNLNGQLKGLEMRRVQEGDSIYFIGEVGISGSEILVFDIEARPRDGDEPLTMQFKREFFAG